MAGTPYEYNALQPHEIRVVILHPPGSNDEIHCDIQHVSIHEKPSYEALSYTWGTEGNIVPIAVGHGIIEVTPNLAAALQHLRLQDSPRTMWIDAICINQRDHSEKNHQVAFLKEIFQGATCVLVWLGPGDDSSDTVMDYMETLNPEPYQQEYREWNQPEVDFWGWSNSRPWIPPPFPLQRLNDFLSRPWFTRVWVLQEATVNKETYILCGRNRVTWDQLFSLIWSFRNPNLHGPGYDELSTAAFRAASFVDLVQFNRFHVKPCSLFRLLLSCTWYNATDPRDRIYAAQSLADDTGPVALALEPDYEADVNDVYIKMAIRFLNAKDPTILGLAGRQHQNSRELASWVPDWTTPRNALARYQFQAGGLSTGFFKVLEENNSTRLQMQVLILSSISTMTGVPSMQSSGSHDTHHEDSRNQQGLKAYIERCFELVESKSQDKLAGNKRDFWKALVVDTAPTSLARLPKDYGKNLALFPTWLSSCMQDDDSDHLAEYLEYLKIIGWRSQFRNIHFVVDSEGNMCLVPSSAGSSGLIAFIPGVKVPLAIRLVERDLYEIIGECYVHGYMDGEAFDEVSPRPLQELVFC